MISAIIAAIAAALKLITEYMRMGKDKLLIALGGSQQAAESLRQRIDAIQQANALREQARADMNRDPEGGAAPDEFMRPDKDEKA